MKRLEMTTSKTWSSKVKDAALWVFYMFVMPLIGGIMAAMGWRC